MLTDLGPRELSDALTCVRHSLGETPLVTTVDACLAAIHSDETIIRDSSPPTKFIRDIIATYSECLTSDALERLQAIPVFCHDLPLCNAVARRSLGGDPFVLFYSGLLTVAKYRQSLAILAANLEFMLEQKSNDVPRAKRALSEIIAPAQALSFWFYVAPSPLPEFDSIFCDPHQIQLTHGLGCAVIFVALHELGHIILGHLDGLHSPPAQIATNYVDENIDAWKMMEFAADAFAISGIKPTLKMSFITSVFIILDLISDIECFCLPRKGTHPYVINRVNNLASALGLRTTSFTPKGRTLFCHRRRSFSQNAPAHFLRRPRTKIRKERAAIAVDIFKQSLPTQQECLFALETLKSMYDGIDYLGPHVEGEYAAHLKHGTKSI